MGISNGILYEGPSVKFSEMKANAKLRRLIDRLKADGRRGTMRGYTFSLPSGYTCPFAVDCVAKADRTTGKITDGTYQQFRCFSATSEAAYTATRDQRWHNFDMLRGHTSDEMAAIILRSLPDDAVLVRIHVGGDFFNQSYFDAWLAVANARPSVHFYAYTKSIRYWVANLAEVDRLPNFEITASEGGRDDALIGEHGLKFARVVFSEVEADRLGLEIDHDDSLAAFGHESFALMIHGTQPKGSRASDAIKAAKANGERFAYSRKVTA